MPAPDSYPHVTCGCTVSGQRSERRRDGDDGNERGNSTTMGIFLSDVTCRHADAVPGLGWAAVGRDAAGNSP